MKLTTLMSILAKKHMFFRALMLLSAMLLLPSALLAQGKNAYALWTEGNSTLTFLYTDNEYEVGKSRSGYPITKLWSGDEVLNSPADDVPGWTSVRRAVKVIEIDPSFADARPKSIAYWFDNSENGTTPASTLTTIKGIEYLNTSDVASMYGAFFRCAELTSLDLGGFNTSNVTDMGYMFMGCTKLKTLDLSGFNTGSLTNMSNMFANCTSLATVNVSGFDTKNVTDFSSLFYGCKNLADVDVSGFDTRSATTFAYMFYGCSSIVELDVTKFTVDNVTNASNMFASCGSLATIRAAENADWRGISNTANMFAGCNKLLAVSKDGSSCKYVAGEDMPYACTQGKGYFTSITGYMITLVGYTASELEYQVINDKNQKTVKLIGNPFVAPDNTKVFGSWNTEKDGSGISYGDGEVIDIDGNMILYSQWGNDISLCDITVNPLSYTYSGSECKPSVVIYDDLNALAVGKDFALGYASNIDAGEATVIIRGTKNYAGTVSKTFTIKPANISVATVTPQRQVLAYAGEAQAPAYVLRHGDRKLVEGVDYEVSGIEGNSAVGDYTVTFTGLGNYTGTTTAYYTISAQKAYAVWTEDNFTLTFLMSDVDPVVGGDFDGSTLTAFWSGDDVLNSPQNGVPAWNSVVANNIKYVSFDASFAEASPKSIAYWFANSGIDEASAGTLVQIKNIKNLNTSSVTSMKGAFYNCAGLALVDVSKFTTDFVTDMSYMFMGCSAAARIDVSGFYTEMVGDMSHMFDGCSKLTKIPTDNFNTSNVADMSFMFSGCTSLTEVSVGGFDMEKVKYAASMFRNCSTLKGIDLSGVSTGSLANIDGMFEGCSKISELNLANFNTEQVVSMSGLFKDCSALTSLNISSFKTDNVAVMSDMFSGCSSLASIDVSQFNTANATKLDGMFRNCTSITKLDLTGFDSGKFADISEMFAGCSSLAIIRAKGNADWSSAVAKENAFSGCTALVGVGADGTVCKYDASVNAPNTCTEGTGYFSSDDCFIITYDNNIDGQLAYQGVAKPVIGKVKLMDNPFASDQLDFVAWNTASDGNGTMYAKDDELIVGSDITLYAQWGRDIAICKPYSSIEPNAYTYTGSNLYVTDHDGRIIIMDGSKALVPNIDYTAKYPADNIDVGTYEVQVFGKGEYAGKFTLTYEITPYDLSDVSIEPENAVLIYNGEAQCPDFVLTDDNGNTLEKDVDFKLITDVSGNVDGDEYMVELEGQGNYSGFNYAFYTIKSAYAVWTETNSKLTFVLDENGFKVGTSYLDGHKVTKVWTGEAIVNSPADGKPAWSEVFGSLTTVDIKQSFADVHPVSLAHWFDGAEKLQTIIGFYNLASDYATTIAYMFNGCQSLTDIDLSAFNTFNVADMSHAFDGCSSLTELDVQYFVTGKATKMDGMFAHCTSLRSIFSASGTDWTKSNPSVDGMFAGDALLTGIGNDGTTCQYVDGEVYPFVCKEGKGYFTANDINIITFNDNVDGQLAFQSISKVAIVPTKLRANDFKNPGFLFMNWNTEPDGLGTAYDDEEEVLFGENTTLYAIWKKDIAACSYSFDPASSTFTGEEITPTITLTDGDYTLVENTDYVFEGYSDNVHAGNASAIVRGRGEYAGRAPFGFYISPRNIKEVAVVVLSPSTSLEYNKESQAPEYSLVYGTHNLVLGDDYTMSSIDDNIDVAQYTVTFTGKGDYTGSITSDYEITPRDITVATVDNIADQEFGGIAIEPAITVKDGDYTLKADEDYTVAYSNNISIGTANVKIFGTGNYKNTIDGVTFKIVPLPLAKVDIRPQDAELPYNRGPQNPEYVLSINGITLAENTDYTISGDLAQTDVAEGYTVKFTAVEPGNFTGEATAKYSITKLNLENYATIEFEGGRRNFKYTGSLIKPVVSVVDIYGNTLVENIDYTIDNPGNTEMGAYDISATGIGNYEGSVAGNYRIVDKSLEDATIVLDGDSFTYNGSAFEPGVTVTAEGEQLVEGTDYTVSYNNNVNAGDNTAEVILDGLGRYLYSNVVVNFTINPRSMDNVTVLQTDGDKLVYNGTAQVAQFTLKDGDLQLTESDYTVGDYSQNIDAGEYTLSFFGKGNYTGTATGKYVIKGISIEDATITTGETEKTFTGEAQTIALTVYLGDQLLELSTDYSVIYENNVNVGTATATVDGKGNYAGKSNSSVQFQIVPLDMANVDMEPKDGQWSVAYTGEPVVPSITFTNKYGKVLEEGKDYEFGDYSGNIEIGEGYSVAINGKGNYKGSLTANYKIKERSIEDAEIIFIDGKDEFTYTGSEIKPVEKIVDLGKTLVEGIDYLLSYTANKEPGIATITVVGRGTYQGNQKIANFTIKPIEMSDVTISLSANTFEYNKTAQAPVFTLTDPNGYTLVAGEDFTIAGAAGNVNAGEYTVTFAAVEKEQAHYNGDATATYTITPKTVDPDDVAVRYDLAEFTYNAQPQQPTITVLLVDDVLIPDTDYEVSLSDHVNAGTVSVSIAGKGNYEGFSLNCNDYIIKPYPLADNMIQLASGSSKEYMYNRRAQAPALVVNGVDGNPLVSGTDFDATSTAYNVDIADYTITFTGKGNYTGTAQFVYSIKPYDISGNNSVVEFKDGISEFDYDGNEVTPEFTVSAGGQTLAENTEYTVGGEPTGKNAKRYTIEITGQGNYTGTQYAYYRILPKNISGTATVEFYDGDKYIETGSEIKPEVFVNDGSTTLDESDYEVAYTNNVAPGTGIANVTGVGNYEGFQMSKEFTIMPKKPVITFNVNDGDQLEYGVAKIGEGILATVDDIYKGTISYNYADGELLKPTKQGESYTIVATYNPDNNTTEAEAQVSISVKGRELEVVGVQVETSKTYDANKTATVTRQPTEIKNIVEGDEVFVEASAEYDTQKPGKQTITISYTLSGADAYKYVANDTKIDGEILKEEIKGVAVWDLQRQTAIDYKDATDQADFVHFCAGDKIGVKFNESKGLPLTYTVHFARQDNGDYEPVDDIQGDYPGDGQTIDIILPKALKYGKYIVGVTLENSDAETVSEPFSETFYLDATADFDDIDNSVVKHKWDDVVYVANPENDFISYQWYREDYTNDLRPLLGDTCQYYQEENGLLNVKYAVKINKTDGGVVYSCPMVPAVSVKKSAVAAAVKVYPNPATANQQFTVSVDGIDDYDGKISIVIYNHAGMMVRRIDNASTINYISLPAGQYTGIAAVDGKKLTFRVIVQ